MSSDDIFKAFDKLFPIIAMKVLLYRPHGKNTISIWFSIGKPLIFTYKNDKDWILEPYNSVY